MIKGVGVRTSPDARLYPRRWMPTFIHWHSTRVSLWQSWKLSLQALPHVRDHTIFDYAANLPGQDDVLVARVPFAKFVIVRSPELARHVLVSNQDNYMKSAEYDMLAVAFGRGLVTDLNDETWQRNRRLVQPIFGKRNVDGFAGPMTDAAHDAADRLLQLSANGEPVDIGVEMNRLTVDIIARTMFGTDLTGPMSEVKLARLLAFFGIGFMSNVSRPLRALTTALLEYGPKENRGGNSRVPMRIMRAAGWVVAPRVIGDLKHAERVVDGLVEDHRTGKIARKDNLLALLIDARDPETGHQYSNLEIHDELMTFIGAGMETTATALTWTWKLLSEHPDVRARLQDELREVLGGRTPTAADIDNLPWTKAVVAETMRVYPPIVGLARVAKGDDVLGDYPIKAGTTVAVLMHAIHHSDRIWERSETFDPARFLAENLQKPQKQASMPFGAGKRMCVASGFANMEAALVIATLTQRLDLDLVPQDPIRRQISFTGGPDGESLISVVFEHVFE